MAYRAKFYKDPEKLKHTRTEYNRRYYQQTAVYGRRRWTQEEIDLLFQEDITDRELSDILHRSMKAIVAKRHVVRKSTQGYWADAVV